MLQELRPKRCIVCVIYFFVAEHVRNRMTSHVKVLIIVCFVIKGSLPICCQSTRPIGSPLSALVITKVFISIPKGNLPSAHSHDWRSVCSLHSALTFSWAFSSSFLCLHRYCCR